MRLLLWVAGGRDYTDDTTMARTLRPYAIDDWILVTGAARGADLVAERLWREWDCPYIGVPARWGMYKQAAGPARNQHIVDVWAPTRLVWFPGGTGTADAVRRATTAGIVTVEAVPA